MRRAREGSGSVIVVSGRPGIGKSAFLREASARAERLGFTSIEPRPGRVLRRAWESSSPTFLAVERRDLVSEALCDEVSTLARQAAYHRIVLTIESEVGVSLPWTDVETPCDRLELQPLEHEVVREMLSDAGAQPATISSVVARACGNPRHSLELLRHGRPVSIETALRRLGETGPAATRTAVALATCAHQLSMDRTLTCRVTGISGHQIDAVVAELERLRLVGGGSFHDELVRSSVESAAHAAQRIRWHQTAAAALERVPACDDVDARIARHFLAGGRAARAAEYEYSIANRHFFSGRFPEARDRFERALATHELGPAFAARAHSDLSIANERLGHVSEAIAGANRAATSFAALGAPVEVARARDRATRLARMALGEVPRAHEAGDATDRRATLGEAENALAAHDLDRLNAALLQLRVEASRDDEAIESRVFAVRASAALLLGKRSFDETAVERDFARALALAERCDDRSHAADVLLRHAAFATVRGRARQGRTLAARGLDHALRLGDATLAVLGRLEFVSLALNEGDFERAAWLLTTASPGMALGPRVRWGWLAARCGFQSGMDHLLSLRDAEAIARSSSRAGVVDVRACGAGALALVLARAGRADAAAAVASEVLLGLRCVPATLELPAMLAAVGNAEAKAHAAALSVHVGCNPAFAGIRPGAAATTPDRSGAVRSIEPRMQEPREPRPDDSRNARFADLSDGEWRIVALIVRGHGNRDIATRLHLSVSTVEKHVSSILKKLGVRSRHAISLVLPDNDRAACPTTPSRMDLDEHDL